MFICEGDCSCRTHPDLYEACRTLNVRRENTNSRNQIPRSPASDFAARYTSIEPVLGSTWSSQESV